MSLDGETGTRARCPFKAIVWTVRCWGAYLATERDESDQTFARAEVREESEDVFTGNITFSGTRFR